VIAAVLIAAPFLFGFSGESTPTAVFIAGGVIWLLMSIGTRYRKEETPARGEPKRRREAAAPATPTGLPPAGTGTMGGAAAAGDERPSRVRPSADAVPDDSIPEFEPPPPPRK
jgi:small neutral amino acid transporter SnatA (MarC family)